MPTIVEGVDFDTIAREWRFKWSGDDEKVRTRKPSSRLRTYMYASAVEMQGRGV